MTSIYNVGVLEKFRRLGVGYKLITATLELASQNNYDFAILATFPDAEAFYKRLGFRKITHFVVCRKN